MFPLVKKDGMPEVAQKIYRDLKTQFNVFYDEKGAVGRRYRRQDEIGTPYLHHGRRPDADRRHRHDPRPRHAQTMARESGGLLGGVGRQTAGLVAPFV